mgnify:CR=1 FL=1
MQSIPSEIIESARIDGANTVDIFSKIVIPNVKSMIQVCIIINLSGAIKTFDIPYMMTQGGPGASSTFLAIYMYKEAFVDSSHRTWNCYCGLYAYNGCSGYGSGEQNICLY